MQESARTLPNIRVRQVKLYLETEWPGKESELDIVDVLTDTNALIKYVAVVVVIVVVVVVSICSRSRSNSRMKRHVFAGTQRV